MAGPETPERRYRPSIRQVQCAASVNPAGRQRDHFVGGFDTGQICADVKSCCEYASQQKSLPSAGVASAERGTKALAARTGRSWRDALAERGKLPKIVTDPDIRGILHAHTNRSDGGDTLEVMAEATRVRGTWRNDVGKRKAQQDGDMSRLNDRKPCGKHL